MRSHQPTTRCRGGSRALALWILLAASTAAHAQAGGGPAGAGGAGGGASGAGGGDGGGAAAPSQPIQTNAPRDDPFKPWFDAKRGLEDRTGTRVGLNLDFTIQQALAGPDLLDRSAARYDFGLHQRLWTGAEADLDVRGGWGDGVDVAPGLLHTVNTNQYANTGTSVFVLHLWLQQKLLDDQLTLRAGKMDLGDWIDTNRYGFYNFLGYSFAHNSSIPLPGNPLAAMFTFEPKAQPWFYVQAGVANGSQSSYRAGFEELADGPTSLFAIGEFGLRADVDGRKGTYRFIGWYDGRDLPAIDGGDASDDRTGVAISFDQEVVKNIGVFARYGTSLGQEEFSPQQYWSAGVDWTGPIPGRPRDDLAIGIVQNRFGDQRGRVVANASDDETYVEAYYNLWLSDGVQVQPVVQVVTNPGGVERSAEVLVGLHVAFRF